MPPLHDVAGAPPSAAAASSSDTSAVASNSRANARAAAHPHPTRDALRSTTTATTTTTTTRELWERAAALDAPYEAARELSEKDARRVRRTKRKDRPDLPWPAGWSRQGHAARWPDTKARLLEEAAGAAARVDPARLGVDVPRVHASELTLETFRERFERPLLPCIVDGLADGWRARERWSVAGLVSEMPDTKLKCGEDDDENSLKLKLKTFARYQASEARTDDSPLYVFDSAYDRSAKQLLDDYCVPDLFPEDLFSLVGDARRPPHRWILMGPERSGTTLHVDPLGTSAWNTTIRGRKLWVCFAPDAPRALVKGRKFMRPGGDDEAVDWFADLLPAIVRDADFPRGRAYYRFVQNPGETVFVPHDWWHAVLNLDDTVAVTQNYVGSVNFLRAWRVTRVERRKMARKWRSLLAAERPDLYEQCVAADKADGFDLDEHIRTKKEERESRRRRWRAREEA